MYRSYDDIILRRRTTRHLDSSRPISADILNPILEAGRLAPSAKNFQPMRYIVVLSEAERYRLHAVSQQAWFYTAPSYIVLVGDHNIAWQRPHCNISYVDVGIAITHMFLKAEDLGLGATTVAAFDQKLCRELLGLAAHEEPILILAVGYPDPAFVGREGNPHRKSLEDLVTYL